MSSSLAWELTENRGVKVSLTPEQLDLLEGQRRPKIVRNLAVLIEVLRIKGFVASTLVLAFNGSRVEELPATLVGAVDQLTAEQVKALPIRESFDRALADAWLVWLDNRWNREQRP